MPSIPNRTDHETRLADVIDAEFGIVRAQAARDVGQVNYEAFERDTQKKLAEAIALIYLIAMAGMEAIAGYKNNRYVAIARATDYANTRAAQVISGVSSDLRTRFAAGESVDNILDRRRAEVIAVTEMTAAITAGEFAIGKPDADRNWLALVLLYGLTGAREAWLGYPPGNTVRELVGWPRPNPLPGSTSAQTEPPPTRWPAPTPARSPRSEQQPEQQPELQVTSGNQVDVNQLPAVLFAIWVVETIPGTDYPDARVCPVCLGKHNKLADDAPPPAHPVCRCWLNWVPFDQIAGFST